jgi:hypothetical protein
MIFTAARSTVIAPSRVKKITVKVATALGSRMKGATKSGYGDEAVGAALPNKSFVMAIRGVSWLKRTPLPG